MIEFADDGAGIPPDVRDRIYEPFFTKEVGKGSGHGLAIPRSIVKHHSGTLECASEPGRGTCFTIRLPLQPAATAPARPLRAAGA